MIKYKKTKVILSEIDKVICDKCKNEIEVELVEYKEYLHTEQMPKSNP